MRGHAPIEQTTLFDAPASPVSLHTRCPGDFAPELTGLGRLSGRLFLLGEKRD